MEVYIRDAKDLEEKISRFKEDGAPKMHVLSDFDRTLTKAYVDGERIPSVISILRDGSYLSEGYAEKAHALFDKYHPIEIDPNVSMEDKKKAMLEWWTGHFELKIESGLNRKDIERVVKSPKLRFREGALDFVDLIYRNEIPLVVLSSAGLGEDSISMLFEREGRLYDTVLIVSNGFEWDGDGNAVDYKKPVIHVFNKDETALPSDVMGRVENRKNVILLGDSLGDLGMIDGFDYDNLIKVGFYNEEDEKGLEEYKDKFDVVITGDGDFSYVNGLLEIILDSKS